jgi:hypothetical protein
MPSKTIDDELKDGQHLGKFHPRRQGRLEARGEPPPELQIRVRGSAASRPLLRAAFEHPFTPSTPTTTNMSSRATSLPVTSPVTEPLMPLNDRLPLPTAPGRRRAYRARAGSIWRKASPRRRTALLMLVLGASVLVFGLALAIFSKAMAWLDPIYFYRPMATPPTPKIGDVSWRHCAGPHVQRAECGSIVYVFLNTFSSKHMLRLSSVPLDYADHEKGVAVIEIGRYNATAQPRRGMIVFNPGASYRLFRLIVPPEISFQYQGDRVSRARAWLLS